LSLGRDIASRAAVAIDNSRLHERANQASRAKSNFLAVMSHELRTPLSAITGYADLMEAGIPDQLTEKQTEQVGRIKLRAYDLLHMIEEILAFSRLEAGQERFRFEDVDIGELIRDVTQVATPLAEERGLRFRPIVPDDAGHVRTDPNKARHILLDLISNAIKFTKQGEIALEARIDNGNAVFRVSDTGLGIAPEFHERIFEPFFQVEDPMTREKGGSGIGLSVARRLANHLGGEITLESNPGQGTTFTVTIPRHRDQNGDATLPARGNGGQ
ncbi:MAG: sensor histidine kinase, partial [Solimonas sp.]